MEYEFQPKHCWLQEEETQPSIHKCYKDVEMPLNKFQRVLNGNWAWNWEPSGRRPLLCLCTILHLLFSVFASFFQFSSVQFSRSVVSDSLWPHESQHARPPYPSPAPRVYSNSCPLSRWCHPAISSSKNESLRQSVQDSWALIRQLPSESNPKSGLGQDWEGCSKTASGKD